MKSVEEFAKPDYGVEFFKLESPVAATNAYGSSKVQTMFDEMGRLAGLPWAMLSAGAGKPEIKNVLKYAYAAGSSGFLAGRAIWLGAFHAYPDWVKVEENLRKANVNYM